ncbi:MAG TPA: pilus assembly protein TadG-related protein [Gaiellaceae bacterium]|nr:pilus assembly protein TadG-related protein [Gaiellaceae bacterium]
MRRRFASESGQALVMTVVFLVVLVGATAITIDFGAWYRQQRQAQATADAAALAGAQALPTDPSQALTLAEQYAAANGGGIAPSDISFPSNNTILVHAKRTSPSFFARLFSFGTVTVHATAAARASVPSEVYGAAPIVVNKEHPDLTGVACGQTTPCFGNETTVPLDPNGAPGAFGFTNLAPATNNGVPPLAQWIQYGFNGYLPLGNYDSDPGAKFNSDGIPAALTARLGTELLFPVYDLLQGGGSVATYRVIGWVGFHLDCFGLATSSTNCSQPHGTHATLTGYFTRVIWDGLPSSSSQNQPPDFGVYSVSLVN